MSPLRPPRRHGPLLQPRSFDDTKDPCPVHDGTRWHLFGSGGSSTTERWQILHAVADSLEGPWTEVEPSVLHGVKGDHVAAPGLVHDGAYLHMFVQTDFAALYGTIEHLVSDDGGWNFTRLDTALHSAADLDEATVYDPHPAEIDGLRYLVYAAGARVGMPDVHLARSVSGSWHGPWERLGTILRHEEVPHHNPRGHHDYEWGLEGPQLLELPDGRVLMNAVCFLPEGERGTRQRVFFAVADAIEGPYRSLGPALDPLPDSDWESGENGHATAYIRGDELVIFYQARSGSRGRWRYGIAEFDLACVTSALQHS